MEMEKRINSQEQEEDVIDLMEIARLLLHKQKIFYLSPQTQMTEPFPLSSRMSSTLRLEQSLASSTM